MHTLACPYANFLRYEGSYKIKTNEYLAFGNALHVALEEGHKQAWSLTSTVGIFRAEFKRIINDDEVFISWPKIKKYEAEGTEILERYNQGIEEGAISSTPFAVEKEFKLPLENVIVVGKIDKIDRESDEYTVTDYKSASKKPDPWFLDHDLQFTCYAWACQELYGKIPEKLIWHHLRTGELLVTHRTQRDIDELKVMIDNAVSMNQQGIRHRIYHSQVCGQCDFSGMHSYSGIGGNGLCDDRELEAQLVAAKEAYLNDSRE